MQIHGEVLKKFFQCICIFATSILVGMWICIYNLDNDLTIIEHRNYHDYKDDAFPVVSICFKQFFDNNVFRTYGKGITAEKYKQYLFGESYDDKMAHIDFHKVTTNISDFLFRYTVGFRNGTEFPTFGNAGWKSPYYTFSWKSWGMFLKCFDVEITDKDLYFVRMFLKRSIFENNANTVAGEFAVLFHYPNQVIASLPTLKRQWLTWDNHTNHVISFNVKSMDVVQQRYKPYQDNCVSDWKNYHNLTLANHLKYIGCKTPDQITNATWTICPTKEKMRQARINLINNQLRPCRELESIEYDLGENKDFDENDVTETWPNWFGIVFRILNPRFRITIHKREVDIQCLVGYIGGYIGLLTGFAVIRIPEVIIEVANSMKIWVQSLEH